MDTTLYVQTPNTQPTNTPINKYSLPYLYQQFKGIKRCLAERNLNSTGTIMKEINAKQYVNGFTIPNEKTLLVPE